MKTPMSKVCHQCEEFKGPERAIRACSKCKQAYYCSRDCQTKHWPVHKLFCRGRSAAAPADSNETLKRIQHAFTQSASIGAVPSHPYAPAESLPRGEDELIGTSIPRVHIDDDKNAPDGHTECLIPAWLKDFVFEQPGFPHVIPSPNAPAHRLGPSPGAGIGMFATRNLAAGELIFAERALTVTPQDGLLGMRTRGSQMRQLGTDAYEGMLQSLLLRMKPEREAAYRALANSHAHASDPLLRTQRANALELVLPIYAPHEKHRALCGVCEVLSRINHSCRPNAILGFHAPSFSYVLTAARAIPDGTEITHTYVGLTQPAAARQRALAPYAFRCNCAACGSPRTSDARRRQIAPAQLESLQAVQAWVHDAGSEDDRLVLTCTRLLRLMEAEGLEADASYGAYLGQLAMAYAALGDRERYVEERENAMRQWRAHRPVDGGDVALMLPEVPERQIFWAKRARTREA